MKMEVGKSRNNLLLVGMSRTPVPDGHKVDIFYIRQLHLINSNDALFVNFSGNSGGSLALVVEVLSLYLTVDTSEIEQKDNC